MRWLICAIMLLALVRTGEAADLTVKGGSVQATWRAAGVVSVSPDAVLRVGHSVTVTLAGRVDINQERKSERKCALFGTWVCKDVPYIEHHWVTPAQVQAIFQIRKSGTTTVVAQASVGAAPVTLQVPKGSVADFTAAYEVVALLSGVGSSIDPGRSASAYEVTLAIDASSRASDFAGWVSSPGLQLDTVLSDSAIDQALKKGHARKIATVLRSTAKAVYPLPTPASNRQGHEQLLRKAAQIADDDPANNLALADMFRLLGLYALAADEAKKALTALESKTDPRSRRLLGDTYRKYALNILKQSGGLDSGSAQEASALLTKALAAYRESKRRDLQALALTDRAQGLSGLRSREALATAASLYEEALTLSPVLLGGRGIISSLPIGAGDDSLKSFDWKMGYSALPVDGTLVDVKQVDGEMFMAWDAAKGRALSRSGKTLQWRSLDDPTRADPLLEAFQGNFFLAANGAIVAQPKPGEIVHATSDGLTPVRFGTAPNCTVMPPAPFGPRPVPASLGPSGDILAVACGDSVYIHHQRVGEPLKQVHQQKIPALPVVWSIVLEAGPAACGVFLATPPLPGGDSSLSLIRLNGVSVPLKFPAAGLPPPTTPIPAPGFPQQPENWPLSAAFSPDGQQILVARSGKPLVAFNCNDGKFAGEIAMPSTGAPSAAISPGVVKAIGGGFLAIIEPGSRIILFDWATKSFRSYTPTAEASGGQFFFGPAVLPPATPDGPPRYIHFARTLTINKGIEEDAQSPTTVELNNNLIPPVLLAGNNYLLNDQPTRAPQLVELKTAKLANVPVARRGVAVPVSKADGWAALRFSPSEMPQPAVDNGRIEAIELFSGTNSMSYPLPPVSAEVRNHVATNLKKFVTDVLSKQPDPTKIPDFGAFPPAQVPKLIADPDRVRIQYRNGLKLPPLSRSPSVGAHLTCGWPVGVDDAGHQLSIPMMPPVWDVTLVTYAKDQPTFTRLPTLMNCYNLRLVPGQVPTVISVEQAPGVGPPKFTLKVVRGDNWVTVAEGPFQPLAGWTTADNSILLVFALDANAKTFALKRLAPNGGLIDACAPCGNLKLGAAVTAIRKTDSPIPTSWDDLAMLMSGPGAVFGVDETGQTMAYPDEEESVVFSLANGRERLRTSLAPLAYLKSDIAVFGPVDERLEVQPLSP